MEMKGASCMNIMKIIVAGTYSTAQVKEPKNSLLRISAFRELPKNTRNQTE